MGHQNGDNLETGGCYLKVSVRFNCKTQGGNSQNFLRKFVRFFLTLRCFYRVVIHRK